MLRMMQASRLSSSVKGVAKRMVVEQASPFRTLYTSTRNASSLSIWSDPLISYSAASQETRRNLSVDTDYYRNQVEGGGRRKNDSATSNTNSQRRLNKPSFSSDRSSSFSERGGSKSFTKPLRGNKPRDSFARYDSQGDGGRDSRGGGRGGGGGRDSRGGRGSGRGRGDYGGRSGYGGRGGRGAGVGSGDRRGNDDRRPRESGGGVENSRERRDRQWHDDPRPNSWKDNESGGRGGGRGFSGRGNGGRFTGRGNGGRFTGRGNDSPRRTDDSPEPSFRNERSSAPPTAAITRFRESDRRIGRSASPNTEPKARHENGRNGLSPKRLPGNSQARSDSQGNERKEHVDRSSPRKEYNAAEPQRVSIPPEVGKGQQKHRIRYFPPNKLNTFIVCHPGLEPYLSQELSALGLQHTAAVGGAQLTHPATSEDLLNCHLYLGTATQVLIRCGDTFAARGLPELRRKVEKLPWNEILRDDVQLKIRVSSSKSLLMHSTAIRDRVVEGIYGVLGREVPDAKELEETSENAVPLTVRVSRDRVQISIDSSLTPMHQRGYRLETGKAPLREDLAYAFLLAAGWKPLPIHGRQDSQEASMYNAFLDPFCGSGTIPIEAASMASGLPPGRLLSAPFRGTHLHDPDSWEKLVMKALKKSAGIESTVQISASDRDKGGLEITKSNAKRAGVLGMIDVQHCAFSGHPWLEDAANTPDRMLMAANLPFGRRVSPLGSKDRIKQFLPLHQTLATRFGDLSDAGRQFTAILLTDDPVLVRRGGYKTGLNIKFSTKHGGIPVSAMLTMGSGGAPPVETKQIEQESAIDASV